MSAPVDLPSFIRSLGIDEAAALFDEKPPTVKSWLYRERYPARKKVPKLIERSKGQLTRATIYGERV